MFESSHVDLDIRFKVVLKNQFQMSMVNSRNFTFHAESHRYHENGLRTGKVEMVDKLTKGYDRTTLEAHFQQDNTRVWSRHSGHLTRTHDNRHAESRADAGIGCSAEQHIDIHT